VGHGNVNSTLRIYRIKDIKEEDENGCSEYEKKRNRLA
jgi:hypothetical protein